jgi:hypothetical protein
VWRSAPEPANKEGLVLSITQDQTAGKQNVPLRSSAHPCIFHWEKSAFLSGNSKDAAAFLERFMALFQEELLFKSASDIVVASKWASLFIRRKEYITCHSRV